MVSECWICISIPIVMEFQQVGQGGLTGEGGFELVIDQYIGRLILSSIFAFFTRIGIGIGRFFSRRFFSFLLFLLYIYF